MNRQISIRLPEDVLHRIDRAAKAESTPRSEFIRLAIEAHLQAVQGRRASRPIDRVRHLIGSVVGSGPRDLALRHSYYMKRLLRAQE